MQGDITVEIAYPDKIKATVALPMGQMVQASDGASAWMQMGPQAMDVPALAGEMKRSVLLANGAAAAIRDALAGKATVQALEQADVDGRKVEVVRWTEGDQNVRFFVDPASRRIVKTAYRSVTPQGAADVEAVWTDHREIAGLTMPGKVVTYRDGQKFTEATMKDAKFNVGLDPKTFAKQ
jgi:hypothetical protein